MIDTHCHLHFKDFDEDRDQALQRAVESGLQSLILVGCDDQDSLRAKELADRLEKGYFTAGFHPHEAKRYDDDARKVLHELVKDPKCVAVGEVGLDFYHNFSPREDQINLLIEMFSFAKEEKKPLVIHSRDASDEMIGLMKQNAPFPDSGVMHCFQGDQQYLKECLDLNFYISFAGIVTFKNAKELQERAKEVPLNRILVETDCPYLTPVPHRGKRNEPSYIKHTVEQLAKIRGISFEEMAQITTQNAQKLFNVLLSS